MTPHSVISHDQSGQDHRSRIVFSAVNRKGSPGYNAGFQKHHLLPVALERKYDVLHQNCANIGVAKRHGVDLNDFRFNGVLLPCSEEQSARSGLPLHRGPHPIYSEMVEQRLAKVQSDWSHHKLRQSTAACQERTLRLDLLLRALRRKLLAPNWGRALLHKNCPLGAGKDFTELDEMAESLWQATDEIEVAELPLS